MAGFIKKCKEQFSDFSYYFEDNGEVCGRMQTTLDKMPDPTEMGNLLNTVASSDSVRISIQCEDSGEVCLCDAEREWGEEYRELLQNNDLEEKANIEIIIQKTGEILNIYQFAEYWRLIQEKSIETLLIYYSNLINKRGRLEFRLEDEEIVVETEYISYGERSLGYKMNRSELLKKYEDASLFLNRTSIQLIPEDFHILRSRYGDTIQYVFRKLECVLSLIYLANSARISNGYLYLQLGVDDQMSCKLSDIEWKENICKLCQWVYEGQSAVERAGIARNILYARCKSFEELIGISDGVLNSVKSNYMIYQRSTTEQYIETKNKIADNIVEMVKEQQDLTKEITDGLRNNLVAVLTFLITVVLSGVDIDTLMENTLPGNVQFVVIIIIVCSVAYLVICMASSYSRLKTLEEEYERLKCNYEDIFDPKDLEQTFGEAYSNMKKRVKRCQILTGMVWAALILIMAVGLLTFSGRTISSIKYITLT